jgi:hypothetical protein
MECDCDQSCAALLIVAEVKSRCPGSGTKFISRFSGKVLPDALLSFDLIPTCTA